MRQSILLLVLANVLGGLTYPWQKMALRGLPEVTLTVLRSLLGLALMAAWLAARRGPLWPFERREAGRLALLGTAGMAVPLLLGTIGVGLSTAANGSILILLEPVAIVLFSRILLGERMGGPRALGLGLGFAGALLVVTEGATAGPSLLRGEHLAGNVLLALSGFLWGLYTPLMKPLAVRHPPVALAFGATVFGLLLLAPAALLESDRWRAGPDLGEALLWTAALGIFSSFLGIVFWTAALKDLPANAVAPTVLLQPLVGVAWGVLFLDERLTTQAGVGAVLVAAGVVVGLARTGPQCPGEGTPGTR